MIIQFCGLSGSGKSTLARAVEKSLTGLGIKVEIIDGDEYRATLCSGLGFSKPERMENVRRMAFVAHQLSKHGVVAIICAINPFEEIRNEIAVTYPNVTTALIDCSIETLKIRDTKGLYKKAFLPLSHPERISNLTGVNDPFEKPLAPDIYINTDTDTIRGGVDKIVSFITRRVKHTAPVFLPTRLNSQTPFLIKTLSFMNSKVAIVVGMHRSGTSVVAQWLSRSGLFIGDSLLGPNVGNEQGHFEDADFLTLHQKFLQNRKCPTTGFTDKAMTALSEPEKTELTQVLESKSSSHEQWGWKEPRTCLFLGEYSKLIPSAFYVIVVRNFNDTVSSLVSREYKVSEKKFLTKTGLSKLKWILYKRKTLEKMFEREAEAFLKVWVHYYEKILRHIRFLPPNRFVVLSYTTLIKNDEPVFSKLKDQWEFSLNYFPFENIYERTLKSDTTDIRKYIKSKDLLARAMAIEREIRQNHSVLP